MNNGLMTSLLCVNEIKLIFLPDGKERFCRINVNTALRTFTCPVGVFSPAQVTI